MSAATPQRLPFLSPEWTEAVRALVAEWAGTPVDATGLRVNATITGVPFGDGMHLVHSEHGPVVGWRPGLVDGAAFSMTLDWFTAKALVLDTSPNLDALSQAIASGSLRLDGDVERFRAWWRQRMTAPEAAALDDAIRDITG